MGWTYDSGAWPVSYYDTSESVIADSMGLKLLLVYLALYIGFVFLMTTAAVLSVQQLSEVADSIPRYRLLAQLGCDRGHGSAKPAHADRHLLRGSAFGCRMPFGLHDQRSVREPAIALGRFGSYRHAYHRHRTSELRCTLSTWCRHIWLHDRRLLPVRARGCLHKRTAHAERGI